MARERTKEEFLDQLVYAVAAVAYHYGPGYSAEGLAWIRGVLKPIADEMHCDSTWRVDVWEPNFPEPGDNADEPNPDFHPAKLDEQGTGLNFADIVGRSKTGEETGWLSEHS